MGRLCEGFLREQDGIRRGEERASDGSSHHRRREEERENKGKRESRGYYCDKPMSKKVLFSSSLSARAHLTFLSLTLPVFGGNSISKKRVKEIREISNKDSG